MDKQDQKWRAIRLVGEGYISTYEAAKLAGVSQFTAWNWCHANGLDKQKIDEARRALLLRLFDKPPRRVAT